MLAQVAYVHEITGSVTAVVGSSHRALKIGDLVESGATVSTGAKARPARSR